MITVEKKTDHVEEALERSIDQYRGKPIFEGWLAAYVKQVQVFEDAVWEVIVRRYLDYARGVQLDMLGKIVGEWRHGRVDDQYRVFIRARIAINRSQGRAKDLLDVLALITDTPFIFDEYYPAAMLLEFEEETDHDPQLIFDMLHDAKAGGVRLNMIVPTAVPDFQFRWSDIDDPTGPSTNGFGDVIEESYGLLSDVVTKG